MNDSFDFNDTNDTIALKLHGYVFSDEEDGATDTESGYSKYDEPDSRLRPPPMVIPQDKIVVIKAKPSSEKRHNSSKILIQKKIIAKSRAPKIITRNFFDVLKQSSSEDSDEDKEELQPKHDEKSSSCEGFESENKHEDGESYFPEEKTNNLVTLGAHAENENLELDINGFTLNNKVIHRESESESEPAAYGWEIKETNKKKRKRRVKRGNINEPFIFTEFERSPICVNKNNDKANEFPKKKASRKYKNSAAAEHIESYDFDLFSLLWTADHLPFSTKYEYPETCTSWDNISENNIRRSNKLIDLEYDNIIGTKEKLEDGKDQVENIKMDSKSSPVNMVITKFLKDFSYLGFWNIAAILIGSYFWSKYNK